MAVVLGVPGEGEAAAVFGSRVLTAEAMGIVQAWLALDDWVAAERARGLQAVQAEAEALRAEQLQALQRELEDARRDAAAAREAERVLAAGWLQQQARTLAHAMAEAATHAFGSAVLQDPEALAAFHDHVLAQVLPQLAGAGRVGVQVAPASAAALEAALQQRGLEPQADVDIDLVPALAPGVCVVHADGALFECDLPAWLEALQAQWAADAWRAWSALAADAAGGDEDGLGDALGDDGDLEDHDLLGDDLEDDELLDEDLLDDEALDEPFGDDGLSDAAAEPAWSAR